LARLSKASRVLTVQDIVSVPELRLTVAGGQDGLGNAISWLHVSELADPTPFLEGGELLLTTGLGLGAGADEQQAYVRRLVGHGLAGLGVGIGFGYDDVPRPVRDVADELGFPVFVVPYEIPFIAITKAAFTRLAGEELEQLTSALEVHERLAEAVLEGKGLHGLLAVVCNHLGCSLALVDERGATLAERHVSRRRSFDGALELPVVAHDELATLRAVRDGQPFGEYDRLVLHHGQTALAFELSRLRAVSAAELRLAGDLLDDLERDRLEDGEVARRLVAFGLDPALSYAALLAEAINGIPPERLRASVARALEARRVGFLSTARPGRAAFLFEAGDEEGALALAGELAAEGLGARIGIGRPARGRALGHSLIEARAALESVSSPVASYRDLGSLELLLTLPDAALEAFVARVLGGAVQKPVLVDSLRVLLESGCRWSEAADSLGIHRHTLRYRLDRFRDLTGRHPDDPAERMELWLAVKAAAALSARTEAVPQ
jgi:PucR family transcriptional regulator, purine catabolism regulatory protein